MNVMNESSKVTANQKQFKKKITISEAVRIHETNKRPVESDDDSVEWTTRTEETEQDVKRRRRAIARAFKNQADVEDLCTINTVSRRLVVNSAKHATDDDEAKGDPDELVHRDASVAKEALQQLDRIAKCAESEGDVVTANPLLCKIQKPGRDECGCTSVSSCEDCIKYANNCTSSAVF